MSIRRLLTGCAPGSDCELLCPGGPCPACVFPKCAANDPCVRIERIDRLFVAPGSSIRIGLRVDFFDLKPPPEIPMNSEPTEGYYVIMLVAPNTSPLELIRGYELSVDVGVPWDIPPLPEGYLLRVKLHTMDHKPLDPPVEACWPILVGDEVTI